MGSKGERIYSVSALNREVKGLLEAGLPAIWIQGEVSRIATPASGHLYFVLKDADARVDCVVWRTTAARLRVRPRDGMQVLIRGRVGLYERDGRYQLYADKLEDAGEGLLRQRLDELRRSLSAEGLFDATRKLPLPRFPRRIGVITSQSGAAIGDVLRVLARRCPAIPVVLYPTPVQGAVAAASIAEAIRTADTRAECDVLILCRGGGSMEDLWCFNDELVVRAIAACRIPLVSGVGHDMDVTLADLVADLRAPTPSGAAELASPDRQELMQGLSHQLRHLRGAMHGALATLTQRKDIAQRRLAELHPGVRMRNDRERLAQLTRRARLAMRADFKDRAQRLRGTSALLRSATPARDLEPRARRLRVAGSALTRGVDRSITRSSERYAATVRALEAVSPLATLARGYAVLEGGAGLLRSVRGVKVGDAVRGRLSDGELALRVEGVKGEDR